MSIKKTKRGYQVDWRDVNGQRHRSTLSNKKDAETFERDMIREREQGVLPHKGKDTLGGFIKEWEDATYPTLRQNTVTGYKSSVSRHILPWFKDMQLKRIDQRAVQEWANHLTTEKGLSARTVQYQVGILVQIIGLAAKYGMTKPISRGRGGIRMPKQQPRRVTPPTVDQVLHLANVIDPRYSALILVAGFCGLRQSEAFGLHPDAVDFEKHRIHVYRTVEHSGGAVIDTTKNGKDRYVTMPTHVEASLEAHIAEYPCAQFVFHRQGRHLDSSHFHRDVWKPAKTAAGLDGKIHFHDLRHSAASIMIAARWSPKRVQIELGHHDPGFTLRVYTHLFEEHDEKDRDALNLALADALEAARSAPGETRTPTPRGAADFEPAASTDSATGADEEDTP